MVARKETEADDARREAAPAGASAEAIRSRILFVRGKRVLLDADLARFYGVQTRELNKAVSRNGDRFPEDFAFKLTLKETKALMFQSGISKPHEAIRQLLASPEPTHGRKIGFHPGNR